jgi:hypothetical protein
MLICDLLAMDDMWFELKRAGVALAATPHTELKARDVVTIHGAESIRRYELLPGRNESGNQFSHLIYARRLPDLSA